MSSDVAIRIQGLSKSYRIKHQEQHITLAEQVLHRIRRPFTKIESEVFWALQDIDLEIKQGEVLGLIGRNGAGKSTLLKVLARITPPTKGRVDVFGRVGSLLEVGTGFHPELTGRENIFLNGAILGMRKPEIERQFDEIVDFAGIERFLDTPVKRYSSGMYVRLAFAVAAHLDTEILFIDEVLAVGDAEFQEKCLGKMGQVAASGRTIVLVSHNASVVRSIATTAVLLRGGCIEARGEASDVLSLYADIGRGQAVERTSRARPDAPITLTSVTVVRNGEGRLDRAVDVQVVAHAKEWSPAGVGIGIVLHSPQAGPVAAGYVKVKVSDSGELIIPLRVDLDGLPAGDYRATVNIASLIHEDDWALHDSWEDAFTISSYAVATDGIIDRWWDSRIYGHHRLAITAEPSS